MAKANIELSLSSTTYKNHIFEGFSQLQQNDEFVDMTLAADGHLVKVHQNIVALASPYLKELLRSVPSPHPVIFLNGVSHDQLSFILEYIYRGEVQIPVDEVQPFVKIAQVLHIAGLKNINPLAKDDDSEEENTRNVFFQPDKPPPVADTIKNNNENKSDLLKQEPVIGTSVASTENKPNYDLPFCIEAPVLSSFEPSWSEGNREVQNSTNTDTHGKSINNTLHDRVTDNNVSQKPVAKIEIISDSIINRNMTTTSMNINTNSAYQFRLPQLYTQGIVNTKNQDVLINNNETNISTQSYVSTNKIDLSKILNMGGKLVLPQYNTSDDIIMSESEFLAYDNTAADESTNVNDTEENTDISIDDIGTGPIVYTVSNRGSLQMILNDFMYYCHYQRNDGRKRRWRCINYRDLHCRAAIDTDGEQIEGRKQGHSHPNHALKISKKIKKSNVKIFSTIQDAENNTKTKTSDVWCDEETT